MIRSVALLLLSILVVPAFAAVRPKPSQAELRELMDAAFAQAEKVPEGERRDREREIVMRGVDDREEAIRNALFAIALRPRDGRGAFNLIGAVTRNRQPGVYVVNREETDADQEAAKAFLEDLYRTHANTTKTGIGWQAGLAELLLNLGHFEEALKLDRETVSIIDEPQYVRVRLAILEMLNGNAAAFSGAIAKCEGPPTEYARMTANFCGTVARSIASRAKLMLGSRAPRLFEDILAGRAGMESLSWDERMHGLVELAWQKGEAAREDLLRVLAAPDAPNYVKNDAILLLARIGAGDTRNGANVLNLLDCWIARRSVVFPAFPEDGWQKLTAIEHDPDEIATMPERESCLDHDFGQERPVDLRGGCVLTMLDRRLNAALHSKNWPVARETIERAAAIILATGQSAPKIERMLAMYATAEISPQRRKESARVLRYADNLGYHDIWGEDAKKDLLRDQTERVTEPWTSPTVATTRPPTCP